MKYTHPVSEEVVNKTIEALTKNGISAELVQTAEEAKNKVLSLIPEGAEVMTMTSITLEEAGLAKELNSSSKYKSVRNKLASMNRDTEHREMQKLGAAPEWVVGSVHAVTEEGEAVVTSGTGSQLPAYLYGASHVLWVVGTQKIVKNVAEAMNRIKEHLIPLESVRARKAYGLPDTWNTNPSKTVVINQEAPDRIHIIFVNQKLGF
ncbi:MAG: lactate utilization protein [Microgenomates group bacterium]|jgi:L-lactate utilization protein LutC|nr:lactate utilization protein [Candidatus Woesebacteria bacterium]MBP6883006.1 lactate utilization protein [Candidatus Woesebacteria bacterium]